MTINEQITEQLKSMSGWCDPAKAIRLADYIRQDKPQLLAEVGVFAGKSAISMAFALQEQGAGVLYAVDSWAVSDSLVDVSQADAEWWANNVKLDDIYTEFIGHVAKTTLARYITPLRMTSLEAVKLVPAGLGLLHIDGCHSEWSSTSDVCLWLPKLKSGGLMVMDDVNWPSTQTAVRFAEKFCTRLEVVNAPESVCGFFRKR